MASALPIIPITFEDVALRINFSRSRLEDLKNHIANESMAKTFGLRLQLLQEFFFHLVGAREVLALLINEKRSFGLDPERISIGQIIKSLSPDDPILSMISELNVDPRKEPFPSDPYTESAYIYRAVLYRNQVAHRHRVPMCFEFETPFDKKIFLYLDPRNHDAGHSKIEAIPELEAMRNHLLNRYKNIARSL